MENKRCKYDEIAMTRNYIMCPYLQVKIPVGVFTKEMNYICIRDNQMCEVMSNGNKGTED